MGNASVITVMHNGDSQEDGIPAASCKDQGRLYGRVFQFSMMK